MKLLCIENCGMAEFNEEIIVDLPAKAEVLEWKIFLNNDPIHKAKYKGLCTYSISKEVLDEKLLKTKDVPKIKRTFAIAKTINYGGQVVNVNIPLKDECSAIYQSTLLIEMEKLFIFEIVCDKKKEPKEPK